jgi:hypothetical protein
MFGSVKCGLLRFAVALWPAAFVQQAIPPNTKIRKKRSSLLFSFEPEFILVKLIRAAGGCLGINRR